MEITVILKSETEAIRAKKLLSKNGITSRIKKITEGERGCTFALSANKVDRYILIRILRDNGIDYSFSKNDISR